MNFSNKKGLFSHSSKPPPISRTGGKPTQSNRARGNPLCSWPHPLGILSKMPSRNNIIPWGAMRTNTYNGLLLSTYIRSANIITKNTKYTIDLKSNIEKTTQYYYQTLEVGQHHTMDPIMEGILSCSLASSRGHPPIGLPLQIQYFSSCLITLLEPIYIVLPSPKNILEEESSRSRTF
jgi:hypothetical protein